jgi:2-polyprenyl-3-methyl-5-hydroxy-6-metoxy-1,4-benzoquinol methylase
MKPWLLELLRCPRCPGEQPLRRDEAAGSLGCVHCGTDYPVVRGIPRFVTDGQNYAENFGEQWRAFRTVQIDRLAGHQLSETRFFRDTRWEANWLRGKVILDAGCGAGRFADVMAQHGALVVACDLSSAVEACRETELDPKNRASGRGEIATVQADLLALPFKRGVFDAVHCAGVIQHVSDPERAMLGLPGHVRSGGRIFYNFYEVDPFARFQFAKYLLRRITPNWPYSRLLRMSNWLCRVFFYPSLIMSRIPKVRFFNRFLPICSTHPSSLSISQQYELTLLDTIDWYGPKFEIRQDHHRVAGLLQRAGATNAQSSPGLAWAIKDESRAAP